MRFPRQSVCSTINVLVIYLESGLENPQKRTKSVEKSVSKTSINLMIDGAEKNRHNAETKNARKLQVIWCSRKKDGSITGMENARRLPNIWINTQQMSCSLLAFFHLCFFMSFLSSIEAKVKWRFRETCPLKDKEYNMVRTLKPTANVEVCFSRS